MTKRQRIKQLATRIKKALVVSVIETSLEKNGGQVYWGMPLTEKEQKAIVAGLNVLAKLIPVILFLFLSIGAAYATPRHHHIQYHGKHVNSSVRSVPVPKPRPNQFDSMDRASTFETWQQPVQFPALSATQLLDQVRTKQPEAMFPTSVKIVHVRNFADERREQRSNTYHKLFNVAVGSSLFVLTLILIVSLKGNKPRQPLT